MKYVLVGGSAAALAAAKSIRATDAGGEILMLSRDAQVISRPQLHHVASGTKTPEEIAAARPGWTESLGVTFRGGVEVVGLDPDAHCLTLAGGETVSYDRVLLATGARTFFPPIQGLLGEGVLGFRDLPDALALRDHLGERRRIVMIGAGLIGCELGVALTEAGQDVTVVDLAPYPLAVQLDAESGTLCRNLLTAHGLKVICEDSVHMVERTGDGTLSSVVLESGLRLEADVVVCVAGVRANTNLASEAGLDVGRGILIHRDGQTSAQDVYAAGDVAEFLDHHADAQLWSTATAQGKAVGACMAGAEDAYQPDPGLAVRSTIAGVKLVSIGQAAHCPQTWHKHRRRYRDESGMACVSLLWTESHACASAVCWGDTLRTSALSKAIRERTIYSGAGDLLPAHGAEE